MDWIYISLTSECSSIESSIEEYCLNDSYNKNIQVVSINR